jgi:FlaA1/EpsC-like NDP-sugar epimerase
MRPVFHRNHLAMLHDVAMAGASFVLALYVRLGDDRFSEFTEPFLLKTTALLLVFSTIVFSALRMYRGMWRFASLADLKMLIKATSLVIASFYLLLFLLTRLENIPRSVPFIHWMLLLAMLGTPRFMYRLWKERDVPIRMSDFTGGEKIPVLIIGATSRMELFLRDIDRGRNALFKVVAIVDHRQDMIGRTVHGIRIYGGYEKLAGIIDKLGTRGSRPQKIIIADESIEGETIQSILQMTQALGIPIARLPRMSELKHGIEDTMNIRPIAVEDLLGRSQAVRDKAALEVFLKGKTVLVTGAGGSIGSELARQIASFVPGKLVLLDSSEFNLYQIDRELKERFGQLKFTSVLCDVRNEPALAHVFAVHKPDIVFHAAAIKHVPLAEDNPEEAIYTNVIGTRSVAELCASSNTEAMVLISTDKAVNPTNVMGASKRLAERVCQGIAQAKKSSTSFVTVRFGNVLGSTGSVVPLFQEQLAKGGPLTVTHKDMERYFMTIREAVELVILASAAGSQMQEKGPIFVLDMGKPVKIADLARQMIRLAGLRPDTDIMIEYTGLRPGEKLYEELFYDAEKLIKTQHESLMLASSTSVDLGVLMPKLDTLKQTLSLRDAEKTRKHLHALVPEFQTEKAAA